MLQFRGQELNGQRQTRRGQDLFVDIGDNVLSDEIAGDPLAEDTEKIGLLDVFFSVQDGTSGHDVNLTIMNHGRETASEPPMKHGLNTDSIPCFIRVSSGART